MKIFNFIFQNKNKIVDKIDNKLITDQYCEIARLLKEAREQKNLSIEDLSEVSKIPQATLNAIENNIKDLRPKHPFIRSILLKLEDCLSLRKNTLVGLSIREINNIKKDKKIIIRKYEFLNSWRGSIVYFIFLISVIFFLNRYFVSNINVIELQIIEKEINKK